MLFVAIYVVSRAESLEEARPRDEAWARENDEPLPVGTFWQHIYFEPLKPWQIRKEPVRISVSLRPLVVEPLDTIAGGLGLTRSGAIAVAARGYAERLRASHTR